LPGNARFAGINIVPESGIYDRKEILSAQSEESLSSISTEVNIFSVGSGKNLFIRNALVVLKLGGRLSV
jgi:hypothetical protein